MMTTADEVGGWVKKDQNQDDVILEWSLTYLLLVEKINCTHTIYFLPILKIGMLIYWVKFPFLTTY